MNKNITVQKQYDILLYVREKKECGFMSSKSIPIWLVDITSFLFQFSFSSRVRLDEYDWSGNLRTILLTKSRNEIWLIWFAYEEE